MRFYSTFHTLVILMVVLTFSAPFVILAQQNTTQQDVPKDATQDVNAIQRQAIADAEQDASTDHNIFVSIGMGACLPILSLTTGLVGAVVLGRESNGGWFGYSLGNPYAFVGCAGITAVGSYWVIYSYDSKPATERFIGKTSVYVEVYTEAYQKKMRSLRLKWVAVGSSGCLMFTR